MRMKMKFELDDDLVDKIVRQVLKDDYESICDTARFLLGKDDVRPFEQGDLDYYLQLKPAMEVLLKYYFTIEKANEIILQEKNIDMGIKESEQ